ncbi:invertebrate-type lysozyme 3-like [Halyomorpha halys]|uniref:invertebrate-type lysozyme 3-like n=1 Tax=Halyomorpha halys TaxID=286706 RepID=UPI0034D370AB
MLFQYTVLPFLLLTNSAFGQSREPFSEQCLSCICEASSGCNRTLGCEGGSCGPYKITKPYWIDANKPSIFPDSSSAKGAYEHCTTDPECAATAVKNYVVKFSQDCNNDGRINCTDYATIHHLGGYECQGQADLEFSRSLEMCLSRSRFDVPVRQPLQRRK